VTIGTDASLSCGYDAEPPQDVLPQPAIFPALGDSATEFESSMEPGNQWSVFTGTGVVGTEAFSLMRAMSFSWVSG
jgi:hypothetical protein